MAYLHTAQRGRHIIAAIAAFILIAVVFAMAYLAPARCTTEECFMSRANKCMPALYTNKIGGSTMQYETNQCILSKTVKEMDPGEPKMVIDTFLGKSMRCRYMKNDFSPLFIRSVSAYPEACEGQLKDAIITYAG